MWFSVAAPLVAAVAAAAVETIPVRLDDNVSVPATAAAVLWWVSLFSEDSVAGFASAPVAVIGAAFVVNAVVSVAGYLLGTLTISGVIGGAVIGIVIVLTVGWAGWVLLLATFGMAVVTTRIGLRRKMRLGIAEGRGGRRGAGNAFANTGVAAAAAVLAAVSYAPTAALIALRRRTRRWRQRHDGQRSRQGMGPAACCSRPSGRVPPGTPGGVSLVGTAAGLAGAIGLGALGAATGLVSWEALLPITAGATIGAFAESAMGATLEERGVLNNDLLNFLNTAIAAAAAIFIAKSIR